MNLTKCTESEELLPNKKDLNKDHIILQNIQKHIRYDK